MTPVDLGEAVEDLRYSAVGDHWWQLESDEFFDALRRIQEAAWNEGNNQPDTPSVVNPYSLED